MKKLVIMPGGFHPFHPGHMALYQSAVRNFPDADVYVAATADTSQRPFPFEVKQKLARLAGVPADRFVQVKSPFRAQEIVSQYDPKDTQLIFVRSDKDRQSQPQPGAFKKDGSPGYLQPYSERESQPMSQRGYVAYLPTVEFGTGMKSATEIRDQWPKLDPKQKAKLILDLYPAAGKNKKLAQNVVSMLDTVMQPVTENQGWAATLERRNNDQLTKAAEKDPSLLNAMRFAKQHYQLHRDDPLVAFMKWVQRGLMHSEINDQSQDQKIKHLEAMVRELINQLHHKENEPVDETVLVNDPEQGVQLRPDGGMGTWSEKSLISNLADKFSRSAAMLKSQQYQSLYHLLYQSGSTQAIVKALADLERFQQQQGRRPIARGREIDIGEEMAGTPASGMHASYQDRENQPQMDYVEEKWSDKYKQSIDCDHPRGFSQKAHCAGRKK
jgi:phosphopantetheine adenylyltransferase